MEFKQIIKKTKDKVVTFCRENAELVIGGAVFLCGAIVGGIIAYDAGKDSVYKKIKRDYETPSLAEPSFPFINTQSYDSKKDESIWDNDDYAAWDQVCELARQIHLKDGECYEIANAQTDGFDGIGLSIGENKVMHWMRDYETYPADAEAYADMEEDEEEDDEDGREEKEENNTIIIHIHGNTDTTAQEFIQELTDSLNNCTIERVTHF